MLQKIKQSLLNLKNIQFKGIRQILIISALLILLVLSVLSYTQSTWRYTLVFLRFNVLQIILILVALLIIFYNTYSRMMKKSPTKRQILLFLIVVVLFALQIISLNPILENITRRTIFSISNYLFISMVLIAIGIFLAMYDMPMFDNFRSFYTTIRDNVYRNLGVVLFVFFIAGYAGLVNGTFVYVLSAGIVVLLACIYKGLIANIRR